MGSETDALLDLAAAISDGSAVDWGHVDESLSEPEQRLVEQLRLIAMIAGAHRSQDLPPEPTGKSSGPDAETTREERPEHTPGALGRWGELVLIEEVGQGSFGTVYRAHDPRLDRTVAVKILRRTGSDDDQRLTSRLLHEGRTLARVRHPNVVTVYGAGEHEGRAGLWMEFVRGLTLEQMLVRHGPFSAGEAGLVGYELCGALAAVHHAGLVHRDVKAQNVMREEGGRLVLMDFGAGHKRAEPGTASRRVVGTPLYLAPEVLAGDEATIASDIYSLGVLLYHLVTNDFPVKASTLGDLRSAHERGEVTPLQDARPDLQRPFLRVVEQALEPDPSKRFASARQMEAALAEIHGSRVSKVPRLGASSKRTSRSGRQEVSRHDADALSVDGAPEREPSIAVMPFANMGADKEDEYFSDGLTEEIINVLAHLPGLKVTARTSAFALRGKKLDIRKIGEVLGVRTILEGSVRRAGTRLRVTAQLVSAADGYYLWSEHYDREMADVFAIQDEIAKAIATALELKLALEPSARRRYSPSLPAYEAYLKAQYHQWKFTSESLARSKEQYEKALTLDPQFALAHIGRAFYFLVLADRSFLPAREAMPLAREAARKALDIDPSLPEARAVLGVIAGVFDYDWNEAESQFRWAMAYDPVPPLVRHWYGFFFLGLVGRFAEAIEENQRALQQDPLNLVFRLTLAMALRTAGRLEEAETELTQILEIDQTFPLALMLQSIGRWTRGMLAEAFALAEEAYRLAPSNPQIVGLLAGLVAQTGDATKADAILRQLGPGEACGASLGLFLFNLVRGDLDRAADWVEKAIEQRHPQAVQALNAKILRSSPRWAALARIVNLPEPPKTR